MRRSVSWSLVLIALLAGWWADSYRLRVRSLDLPFPPVTVYVKDGRAFAVDVAAWLLSPAQRSVEAYGCWTFSRPPRVALGSMTVSLRGPDARSIALWIPITVLGMYWLARHFVDALRFRRRARCGRCPWCAYDLTGHPEAGVRCPECGSGERGWGRAMRRHVAGLLGWRTLAACLIGSALVPAVSRAWSMFNRPGTLHEAARWGRVADIDRLVAAGADVNATDACGSPALDYAALGQLEATDALLRHGADPNLADRAGRTAMFTAVALGGEDIVRRLLAAGADANHGDMGGYRPLHAAFVIEPMMWAGVMPADSGMLRLLVQARADPNIGGPWVVFHHVVARQDLQTIEVFLDFGADPNLLDEVNDLTPLLVAARLGRVDVMKLLVERGARLDRSAGGGLWLIHAAARFCDPDMARTVLAVDADPDHVDEEGSTALHTVAASSCSRSDEIVDVLLAAGAARDARDRAGQTPLMVAAKSGNFLAAKALVLAGADLTQPDHGGTTALDHAQRTFMTVELEFLMSREGHAPGDSQRHDAEAP